MARIDFSDYEIWFVTGSQHLYGPDALKQVAVDGRGIVDSLNFGGISLNVVWQPTVTTPEEATATLTRAGADPRCAGIICWMHTFSPACMWINGLKNYRKPLLHLHTQANRELPWAQLDMDFMNLHQSAHGDREFGFICTRLELPRKIVAGCYQDEDVRRRIDIWARVCAAWADSQTMRIVRIGDNMREVAVTDGNKVSAQIQFGYAVNGYGVGDLVSFIDQVSDRETGELVEKYFELYTVPDTSERAMASIREAARQEIGLRAFLEEHRAKAFTTTFEDLHGLHQLPGLACQRLMAEGFGFGPEGDWKTAALIRTMKVMAHGLEGGVSLMEDYTYDLSYGRELDLGAHMLEVCPSIASGKPSLEVHELGIGGKAAPARLVFDAAPGEAINASMIELDGSYRLLVNELDVIRPPHPLPKLPVARAVWKPRPDFPTAAEEWLAAGGAHHGSYSRALNAEFMEDYAAIAGVELVLIG